MADDLIRRSDVLNPYVEFSLPRGARHLVTDTLIAFLDYVKSVPPVDAVEVIRCRDCVHWEYDAIFADGWCRGKHQGNPDWFCADGERKE